MLLSNVLKKSRPSLQARATSQNVIKIDIVPLPFQASTDLFVSHNALTTLKNVDQFHQLRRLMAEYNQIQYVDDLQVLKNLKQLKELKLNGNPVCYYPFWEYHVLKYCPTLEMLNGKPVNSENIKYARMEDDLTKAVYYLDLINFIVQHQNRVPPLSTEEISTLLAKKLKVEDLAKFRRKFTSNGPQDLEDYKNYIINKCINSANSISGKLTTKHNKQLQDNHVKFLNVMKTVDNMDDLTKVMKLQLGNDLNIGGFYADHEFTTVMRNAFKDDPNADRLIQDCIEIASQFNPTADTNNLDIKPKSEPPTPKKKKKIINNANQKPVPEVNNSPSKKVVIDPNSLLEFGIENEPKLLRFDSQPIITVEEQLPHAQTFNTVTLVEPPTNFAVTHRRKSYSTIQQRRKSIKSNDEDSDEARFSDLSFESQLRRELVEQRQSMSSRDMFSDASLTDEDKVNSMDHKFWPRKRPPKAPSSKEARKFTDTDWEVKLFKEKRERAFMQRTFDAWRGLRPSKQKPRRRSSYNLDYLASSSPMMENTVVGDNFLNAFLNTSSPPPEARPQPRQSRARSGSINSRRSSFNPSVSSPIAE